MLAALCITYALNVLANAADLYTTRLALQRTGFREANPIWRHFFANHTVLNWVFKCGVVPGVGLLFGYYVLFAGILYNGICAAGFAIVAFINYRPILRAGALWMAPIPSPRRSTERAITRST